MADTKYPISFYNKDGAVLQLNNDKERDQAKAKGYGPKYIHSHFPKAIYHKTDGSTLTVNDEADLEAKTGKNGAYTEDYVAPPAPKVELPREAESGDSRTVRALLAEIHDMKNRQEDLEIRLEDLEKAVATAAKKEAKPKGKAEEKKD